MKKLALLALTLMLFFFVVGGSYIISSFFSVTDKLEKVISFQHIEVLRENLVHYVKSSQSGLLLHGSPHAGKIETAFQHVRDIESATNLCFTCHHAQQTNVQLERLREHVHDYLSLLTRAQTIRDDQRQLDLTRSEAFSRGEALLAEVNSLSIASAEKIASRIDKIRADIHQTNYFLLTCTILVPLLILALTFFLLRRFTGSIDILVKAARAMAAGDLNYRITRPLRDEFSTLAAAFNSMGDSLVAERQKYESAHILYQTLFETAGDSIIITSLEEDSMGQVFSANRAACEMYGYSHDEMLGLNIVDLIPDNNMELFNSRIRTVLKGDWFRSRVKRKRKDGSIFPVDLSLGLLRLENKRYLLSFCKDISSRLLAEEEQQRANQMALVGQMAAGLAHEIKNPLAGIKVSLDVLSEDLDLKPQDKDIFVRMSNEISRMERLLRSLLEYARPPKPQFDQVDLNLILESTIKNVEMAATHMADRDIQIKRDFYPALPMFEADSAQLQQVFLNILMNATDAIEGNGIITVVTRMDGDEHVRVEIYDTGKGIASESLAKIFTPFYTTKRKGTGLGLAICKRLVEQHQGMIDVNSRLGEGTFFVVRIPLIQKSRE